MVMVVKMQNYVKKMMLRVLMIQEISIQEVENLFAERRKVLKVVRDLVKRIDQKLRLLVRTNIKQLIVSFSFID